MLFPSFTVLLTLITFASASPISFFSKRQNYGYDVVSPIQSAAAALNIAIAYIICNVADQLKFAATAVAGTPSPTYFDQCEQIAESYPGFHGPKSRIAMPVQTPIA